MGRRGTMAVGLRMGPCMAGVAGQPRGSSARHCHRLRTSDAWAYRCSRSKSHDLRTHPLQGRYTVCPRSGRNTRRHSHDIHGLHRDNIMANAPESHTSQS